MASPQHPTREACGKAPAASRSAVDLPALDLRLALSTAPKDSRSTGAVASSTSAPTFRGGQRTPAHQPTKDRTTVSLLSHPRGAGWTGGHVAVAMPPSAPAAPIVHLRVRPLIPRLGECAEQRQVWCVDHESVVVREIGSRPTLHDHPSGASASLSASPHHPSQSMRQLATRTFPDADQQQNYSTSASVSSLTDGCGTGTRLRGQQSPGLAAQDGLGSSSSRCSGVDQDHDELEEGLHDEAHPPHSSSVNQPENSNPVASPQSSGEGASNPLSPTQVTNSTEAADGTKLEWARHTHHRSASSPRPISCSSTSPCEASDLDAKIEPPSSPLAAPVLLEDTRSVEQQFRCDCVHDDQVTQEEVFEESVVHFADEALLGQNIAILCHGATGSGKTYTMMGSRTHGGEREVVADAGPFPEPHPTNNLSSGRGGRRRAAAVPPSAADQAVGEAPGDDGDEEGDWPSVEELLSSKEVDIDSSTDEDDVRTFRSSEMGILPRLVQVLLERCGERVVLRHREEGLVKSSGSYGSTTPRSVRSSVRKGGEPTNAATPPSQAATTPTTTLTLRELTLFGVEVYMDEVYDLMDPGKRKLSSFPETGGLEGLCTRLIHAREEAEAGLKSARRASRGLSPQGSRGAGTSVVGGGGIPIRSTRDVYQAYALACQNRITASPEMHEHDSTSRSHAVFLLQLGFDLCDARRNGAKPLVQRVRSYAVMVDLAGCERQKVSREGGEARREARSIHQSLSALSSVVQALMQRSKTVPYRDAKLTRLLRPCLEGGHVLVLIHLSPCSAQETQQSLRFADHIHQTRPASCGGSTTKELQSIFDELVDPTLGQQEEEYRQSEDLFAKLCVEVRLAHMTRFPGYISHSAGSSSSSDEEAGGASPSSDSKDESTVAAISRHEHEGGVLEDPSSPSTLRTFLTRTLVERHNAPLRRREQRSMQKARQRIEVEKRRRVEQATQRMQHVLQQARNSIEELQWVNTRLSTEKNAPVPQDPYSLELSKQLKETTEDMSRNARERWSLSTIVSSLKQRLAVQDELELSLDAEIEELPSVHGRGTDGERSLAASITQPSSSTGGEERPDAELRDICRQQAQLAKEMSSLRLEAVCFGMGDGIWEGLWARVMRHELLTAMWVERALMEDIMLDPIGLQFMFQLGGLPVAGRCSATERQLRSRVSSYLTQGSAQAQPPRSSRGKRDKTEPPAISLPPAFRLDGADAHDDDHHPTSTKSAEPRSSDRGPVALATANGGELLRQPLRPSGLRLTEVYGDEEQLQRAAFRRLTEEGLPCEICCVGDTFDAVLSQFLCPTSSKEETDEGGDRRDEWPSPSQPPTSARMNYHSPSPNATASATSPNSAAPTLMTSRWGRLRLQRPTKPQDSFTLDLVYCAHGVPLATPTTTSNNGVEGAVQDKTLSQGVPSSKATSPTAEQKERRLFSIPLFESDLALHAHVLETGTTTASPVPPSHDDDVGAGAPIRRRRENCAQVALELRGIPTSAKTPSVTTPRRVAGSARGGADVDAPVLGTVGEEASPMIPNPASKDVVLAKRLRGGGELLLPCSCIWPSKGSCTILVRFPSPAFAEATRLESIEVLIAGLCSIMPPVVGIPSMPTSPQRGRLYAAAFAPPTPAPGTISTGTSNASSNAGLRERQIGARPCVAAPYAHIPYVLLGPSPSDPSTVSYMRRSISASPEAPYAESEECTESNSSVARATVSRQSSGLQGGGSISSCDQSVLGSTAGTGAFHRGASLHVTFYFPGSLQQPPRAPSASEGGVRTEMEEHPLHGSPLPLDPSDASSHSGGPRGSTVSSAGRSTAQYAPPPQPPSSQPSSRWATEDRPCCIPEDAGTLRSIHTATQILQQLQSVTIGCPAPATTTTGRRHGSERGRAVDEELAIQAVSRRLQQLQGFRRNVRALVKQQIYDAEDIQGEVTNTSAMNEVHRGEHLRSIQREARTAVGLALPVPGGEASTLSRRDASTSFYSPEVSCAALPCPLAGLTVAQGRSICGSAVPWTIWQWAHRWPLISSCYRNWGLPSVSLSPSPPGLHASSAPPWRGVDGSPLATPNLSGIPRSPPWSAAPGQMDDSDSSEEAYGLGHGSWMDETLAANHASPKTVWLPEIQFAPTPLFLRPPGGT